MKLYTINATPVRVDVSENENKTRIEQYPQVVAELLAKHGIDGFTIYPVQGYWKGEAEDSFKIEIATDGDVGMIASELRDIFNQEAVMLTNPNGEVEFI